MSLRTFHILFILTVTLFFAAITAWAFLWDESGDNGIKVLGYIAAVGAVITPAYGVYFYNKAKNLI